ncbi:hypothetical protein [Endozoicomonas sp. 2B-B]
MLTYAESEYASHRPHDTARPVLPERRASDAVSSDGRSSAQAFSVYWAVPYVMCPTPFLAGIGRHFTTINSKHTTTNPL